MKDFATIQPILFVSSAKVQTFFAIIVVFTSFCKNNTMLFVYLSKNK